MSTQRFQIDATTLPFGEAEVFYGDATVAGGMTPVGLIEGDVTADLHRMFVTLTYPEHSGTAPIKEKSQVGGITVTTPMLITDAALLARLSPTGDMDFGDDTFRETVAQTLLIISRDEIPERPGSWAFNGTVWTPAAPKNALWIWKAVPRVPRLVWGHTDYGRRFEAVTWEAHFDTTKPPKHKLATFGDPTVQGITDVRI